MNRYQVGLLVATCFAATGARAQVISPTFAGSYSFIDLGAPSGVPANLGGLTLKAGGNDNLLIGGAGAIVPEPSALALLSLGGLAALLRRRLPRR